MNRPARVALPALTIVVALGVSIAVVPVTVGEPSALLVARSAVRVVLDLSAATVLGVLVSVVLLLPAGHPRRGRLLDVAAAGAGVWTLAAGATAFLLYLGEAPAVSAPEFGPGLVSFVADIAVGRAWAAAAIAPAVLSALLVAVRSRTGVALLVPAAAAALIPVALQSGMSGDDIGAQRVLAAAVLVQLVAAATWIGAVAVRSVLGPLRCDGAAGRPRGRATALPVLCGALTLAAAAIGGAAQLGTGTPAALLVQRAAVLLVALALAVALSLRAAPWTARLELLLLAVAAGLAAGIAVLRTTPAPGGARTTPAEILTGSPLPPPVSVGRLLTAWQPDAVWLLLSAALLAGYGAGLVAASRRGSRWPVRRTLSWALGAVLLAWLTSGGIAVYQEVLLSAHLVQHVALTTAVPLLLAGGAPRRLLAASRPERGAPPLTGAAAGPVPAAVLAAAALLALYATGLLRWSVTDPLGAEWAVLQCLGTGVLLVRALRTGPRRVVLGAGVGLLVVETAGAAALALGSGLLLPDWFGAMGWGTDAHVDQRLGALLAGAVAVVSTIALLVPAGGHVRRDASAPPPDRSPVPTRTLQDEVHA